MKKRILSVILTLTMVLVQMNCIPSFAENTVETQEDGTIIHHIDISSKYNYDTIGNVNDTVNSNSIYWYGFNNNNTTKSSGTYGWTFTAEAQGYPLSLGYFTKDAEGNPTGDLVMKKVTRDESNAATGFSDDDTFTFKIPKEGLKGNVNDALVVSSTDTVFTFNLEPVRTSSVKLAIGNKHTKDWVGIRVDITYEDGTKESYRDYKLQTNTAAQESTFTGYNSPCVQSSDGRTDTTVYNQGVRSFARAMEDFKSLKPVAATDETGETTYTLGEDSETTLTGFRGIEYDVNPFKPVKSITITNTRAKHNNRLFTVYAIAQVQASEEEVKQSIKEKLEEINTDELQPDQWGNFTEEQTTIISEANDILDSYIDLGGNINDYAELLEVLKAYNQQFDYYVDIDDDANAEIFVPGWTASGSEYVAVPESYTKRTNNMFGTKRLVSYLDDDGFVAAITTGNKYKLSDNSLLLTEEGFGDDVIMVSEGNTYTVEIPEKHQNRLEGINVVATNWNAISSSLSGFTVPVTVTYEDDTSESLNMYVAPARDGGGYSAEQQAKRVGGTSKFGNLHLRNNDTGTWYASGDTSLNLCYVNNASANLNYLFEYVIPLTSEKNVKAVTFGLNSSNDSYYIAAVTLNKYPTAGQILNLINEAADETEIAEILEENAEIIGIDFSKYFVAKTEISTSLLVTDFTSLEEVISTYNQAYDNTVLNIITAVTTMDSETVDTVIADLNARGLLTKYEEYEKLTDAGKSDAKAMFIENCKTVTLLSEITAVWAEALELPEISVTVSPENYAIAFVNTNPAYNKTVDLTNVKTYVYKWHEPQMYNKSVVTEFYLPLKNFATNIAANYSYVTEKNEGNFTVRYDFSPIPDAYTVTDKDGNETSVELKKQVPAAYQKEYDVTTEITDETTGETTSTTETVYPDTYLNFKAWDEWVKANIWTSGSWNKLFTIDTPTNKVSTLATTAYDFSASQLEAFKTADSCYITMGNSQGNYYARYKMKEIPTITVTYLEADILDYINSATTEDITDKLINLSNSGVLSLSEKGGEIYEGMSSITKAVVNDKLIELRENEFTSVESFINGYDEAIDYAVNNIIDNPDVYINFDNETAEDVSGNGKSGTIVGDATFVTGFDGTKALRIDNEFGKTASEYLNLGEYDFTKENFTISFNMRAPERGVNYGAEFASGERVDYSQYTGSNGGGVVMSNKDFSTPDNTGFAMVAASAYADFVHNIKVGENETSETLAMATPVDSRWHQITYVVNRSGTADLYVDGVKSVSTDLTKLTGNLGKGNLIFGADSLGQYGMMKGEFDDIKIFSSAITESQAEEMYYRSLLKNINSDMQSLLSDDGKSVYSAKLFSDTNKNELKEKLTASKAFEESYVTGNVKELKEYYNNLNNYYNAFLNRDAKKIAMFTSDIHIVENNQTHKAATNLISMLTESSAWEHPVDTFVMSGDLAHVGLTLTDTFTGIINDYLPENSQLAVCRGNHDNWISTAGTPATAEELPGIIENWNSFLNTGIVDKTHPLNASILDEEGNIASPWYYMTDGAAHYVMVDMYMYVVKYAPYHISDEQVKWLDETLDAVSGDGKPIFVIIHNPLRNTVNYWSYGPIGEEDDKKIKEALKGHDNIFVLNGHLHYGMGSGTGTPFIDSETGFIQINGPSLGQGESLGYNSGCGYYINIYDDKVVFRARDVENGLWLRGYDMAFDLTPAEEEAETAMGEIVISDGTNTYETAADAKGKEVTVTAPVNFAEESGEFVAILAEYNGDTLLKVTTKAVLYTDTEIEFNTTLSDATTDIKVMIFDSLQGMKPLCDVKNK